MQIVEVNSPELVKKFLKAAYPLYKGNSYYVAPVEADLESVFHANSNDYFKHGELIRWVLLDAQQNPIGRIAAFVDNNKANKYDQPTGGVGFFECPNDQQAANLLFDTGKAWLQERGMEAMLGPINFGENNQYWGLLAKAYDTLPYYGTQYQPEYYKELFQNYGFEVHFEQYSYRLGLDYEADDRFKKIAQYSKDRYGFHYEHYDPAQTPRFVDAFVKVHDGAFTFLDNFAPLDPDIVWRTFKKIKAILEPKAIIFAFKDDEPAGFFITFPDANPIIQKLNGKFNLLGKLKFVWYKQRGYLNRLRVVHFGVVEKYQRMGVGPGMVMAAHEYVKPLKQFKELELSWIGDFNPKMMKFMDTLGVEQYKTHWTMIKKF